MKSDKEIVGTLLGFDDFVNILPTVSMGGCMLRLIPRSSWYGKRIWAMDWGGSIRFNGKIGCLPASLVCGTLLPRSFFLIWAVCSTILKEVIQGCSHRSGWSAFNLTTFWGYNHISANIHKFGSMPSRLVGSQHGHSWQSKRSNCLKATLPSLQRRKGSQEPIQITEKWRWIFFSSSVLHATAFANITTFCNCTTSNLVAMAL